MRTAVWIMGTLLAWAPLPSPDYDAYQTFELESGYQLQKFEYAQTHMGVSVEMTLYAPSAEVAERAAKAGFDRFAALDESMSDYRRDSELNKLIAKAGQGPQPVSKDMFIVLQKAQEVSAASNGAFDITAGPLVKVWRRVRQSGMLPYRSEVLEVRKTVGWRNLVLDERRRTADLKMPGMTLDLGGIAKGYGCDEAMKAIRANGVASALISAGGDIKVSAPPPGRPHWIIAVRGWKEPLFISNAAISTSGDSEQFVDIGGRRFSHIVDPRTGYGLTSRIQATVIAPDGLTTDPLATALCVLGIEKSQPLIDRYGVRATFVVGGD